MASGTIQVPQPNYSLDNSNIQVTNYTSSNLLTIVRNAIIMVQLGYNVSGSLYLKTNYASNPVFLPIINFVGKKSGGWEHHSIFLPKGSQVYGEISGGTGFIVCYYYIES